MIAAEQGSKIQWWGKKSKGAEYGTTQQLIRDALESAMRSIDRWGHNGAARCYARGKLISTVSPNGAAFSVAYSMANDAPVASTSYIGLLDSGEGGEGQTWTLKELVGPRSKGFTLVKAVRQGQYEHRRNKRMKACIPVRLQDFPKSLL